MGVCTDSGFCWVPTAAAAPKCKCACLLTMGLFKFVISEVGSEGTTPPYGAGIAPHNLSKWNHCQDTGTLWFWKIFFWISIPSIPPILLAKKCQKPFFPKLFHFLPHVLVFVGIYHDFVVNPPQTVLFGFSRDSRPVSSESLCQILWLLCRGSTTNCVIGI